MERLTTNKDVLDMGMSELAYNSSYAKDGKARFRDFEDDFDARELAIKLLEKYAGIPNEFTCDEDFDEQMIEYLMYGTNNIEGLIAVFYRNLWAMTDLREALKRYEDLEEQGKLLKLPCAVGDTVYVIEVDEENFTAFHVPKKISEYKFDFDTLSLLPLFGKCIFLTREEAESALKEL